MKELIYNKELVKALEELEKEKGIKKDYVIEAIETALVTAYKRNFDAAENVKVIMDKVTGATHIYSSKEVVEAVEDSNLQIFLDEAKKEKMVNYVLYKTYFKKYLKINVILKHSFS